MNEEHRSITQQIPAAANVVLLNEKVEAATKAVVDLTTLVGGLAAKFEAMLDLQKKVPRQILEAKEDVQLSVDRLRDEVRLVAKIQGEQARVLGETHALARTSVDGIESMNRVKKEEVEGGNVSTSQARIPAE